MISGFSIERMRKILVTFFVFMTHLCWTASSWAAPAYGTRLPPKFRLAVGGQTHQVLDRDLEDAHGEVSSLQHFLLLSFGVTDWLSLDLKGGAGDVEAQPSGGDTIQYPAYMAGGYGFRLRFYDQEKAKAVFGFQHISVHPYTPHIGDTRNKAVLDDWQFSILGSYEVKGLTPYLGAKWSRMDYIHWVGDIRKRKKSDLDKSIGLIAGLDVPLTPKTWINVEGQFVDVQSYSVSLNYQF